MEVVKIFIELVHRSVQCEYNRNWDLIENPVNGQPYLQNVTTERNHA